MAETSLYIVPTHLFHGPGWTLESARVITHHRLPQRLGGGGIEQPEPLGQGYLMAGTFIVVAARLAFWRSHPEPSRRNPAQPLSDLQPGEFDENTITILPPTAGPARRIAVGQGM